MITHEVQDGLRRLPWWLKALWVRLGLMDFRPDCIRGLAEWYVFDGAFQQSEFINYRIDLTSGQLTRVYQYLTDRYHVLNPTKPKRHFSWPTGLPDRTA